jgi:hypothetical protein
MDPNDLVITLVHECSHLADKTVKDKGYYESANWDALDDDVKVTNAAHYEEIPRRYLKKSIYADDQEFKPGTSASGNAVTFETEVRRMVDEYGRTCHASAQEIHVRLRQIHVKLQTGDRQAFDANEPLILDISKVFKLTIHDRAHPRTITTLDLSLSEGVAHAAWKFKAVAKAQAFPTQPDPGKDAKHHARRVLSAALKAYGTVTGNDADDRELFKWLFTNKTKLKV